MGTPWKRWNDVLGVAEQRSASARGRGDRDPVHHFDITQRKRAEDALRQSEEPFRILVEQASDGIFITDDRERFVDVNSAGAEMLGYRREEILELSISDISIREDRARADQGRERLPAAASLRSEWNFRRKDNSAFPGEISARRLPDGRIQGILRDITERKRAEETLRESEERFRVARGSSASWAQTDNPAINDQTPWDSTRRIPRTSLRHLWRVRFRSCYFAKRSCFCNTSRTLSCGNAITV